MNEAYVALVAKFEAAGIAPEIAEKRVFSPYWTRNLKRKVIAEPEAATAAV